MKTTAKGRELAWKLNPAIGSTNEISGLCSLIARHATTHHGLQELFCNGGTYSHEYDAPDAIRNARMEAGEAREARIEARISDLVSRLPHTEAGPFSVQFSGDPRGCTVKLVAPGQFAEMHDDWGREGICVPQSH